MELLLAPWRRYMANKHEFEKSLERLEVIVKKLENGDLPLDDSLALFEEGSALIRTCNSLIDEAEQKVTLLSTNPDGTSQEIPFDEA